MAVDGFILKRIRSLTVSPSYLKRVWAGLYLKLGLVFTMQVIILDIGA